VPKIIVIDEVPTKLLQK